MDAFVEAIKRLIADGAPEEVIEEYIDRLGIGQDHRDALWFLVGYRTERPQDVLRAT